jgi:hypothetical protein
MGPVTDVTPTLARAAWGSLETVHVAAFFAPEVQQAYDRFGVPATRAGYFAARARDRGLVDDGGLAAAGVALRTEVETTTDGPASPGGRTWAPRALLPGWIRSRG